MTKPPRIFLANVGVNASHEGAGLKSPRFRDGSFEFVTIPERPPLQKLAASPENAPPSFDISHLLRYEDISCFNTPTRCLTDFLPKRTHRWLTHYDPEFEKFTYGDEGGRGGRAAALRKLRPGDWLFFLARLTDYNSELGKFEDEAGFYLIGALEVENRLADVRFPVELGVLEEFGQNAHLRRARAWPELFYDGFYVFKGTARSRRFQQAYPFGRKEATLFLRDRNGQAWNWSDTRTDLQTIGSYTRTCRCVLDPQTDPAQVERAWALLQYTDLASLY